MPTARSPLSLVALLAGFILAGCTRAPVTRIGSSHEHIAEDDAKASPSTEERYTVADDVVLRAQLPFSIFKRDGLVEISEEEFFSELKTADLICVGEHHDNPHHHFAQLFLVQELTGRASHLGRQFGIGLEMFQLPSQPHLDAYAAGQIDAPTLLEESEYDTRWGWPFAYYRPQIDHAVLRGVALLALNAPKEWTKEVAKAGLDALDSRELEKLGGMDLHDHRHRASFKKMMHGHPKGRQLRHLYAAQVLWDETMANTASSWLLDSYPARQLLIMAGSAHCADSAIPARARRRAPQLRTAGILPVVMKSKDSLGKLDALHGYSYAFAMQPGGD